MSSYVFPFGGSLGDVSRVPDGPASTFVLGAYPSALHAHWRPPSRSKARGIAALAVADEPEPFWDGVDAAARLEEWKTAVGFDEAIHGWVGPAPANGDSGRALDAHYLEPLGVDRSDCWLTDCLTTYRLSEDGAKAIKGRFTVWSASVGLAEVHLPRHPSEAAIVAETLRDHRDRILEEFEAVQPDRVITLGNAALRVVKAVLGADQLPERLDPAAYGRPVPVELLGAEVEFLPLAHPGAVRKMAKWRDAHGRWERLRRLQQAEGGRVYQHVVVSGAHGDWPADTPRHVVDAVHFPDHATPAFLDWQDHQREFAHDIRWDRSVVLTARGYHDRPLLGMLIGGRELLSRSYPDHELISCCALTEKVEANIDWVYRRQGIDVRQVGQK